MLIVKICITLIFLFVLIASLPVLAGLPSTAFLMEYLLNTVPAIYVLIVFIITIRSNSFFLRDSLSKYSCTSLLFIIMELILIKDWRYGMRHYGLPHVDEIGNEMFYLGMMTLVSILGAIIGAAMILRDIIGKLTNRLSKQSSNP
jgi:hypothetical protein